jgi:hypothetical protein
MELVEEIEAKEFRYGVPEDVYTEWRAVQKRLGMPQRQMLHRLIRFLLAQDQVTQMMILGQVEAKDDLIEFSLKRARFVKRDASGRIIATRDSGPRPNANDYAGPTDYRFNKDDPADGGKGGEKPKGKGK